METWDQRAEGKPFPTAAVLGGLALSLFMAALDATIVSTAMPKIAASLGSFDHYTWPFTSYLLTCTLATLLCGACATRFGHKRVFACGISVFAIASAGCALSNGIDALTAWRAVQGVGGGLVEAGVFIAMAELFEPRVRGKYMGILSSMYGLASIAGPLAGGLIADTVGWHWIFLVNLPLSVAALVLVVRFLPGKQAHAERSFDLPGALCAAAAIVPLTLAFSLTGNAFAWFSAPFFGLLALAATMIALLVLVERRRDHAIVPVRFFRRAQVNGAVAMGFCSQFALLVGVMFVPRFVQEGLGLTSTASALATIPMTLALVVGSTLAGRVFGGTPAYVFRRVTLPMISRGIFAGWMMIFIIAFRELVTASLIAPPNTLVVSTYINREFEQGSVSLGMAMAVLCVLITTTALLVFNRLVGKQKGA